MEEQAKQYSDEMRGALFEIAPEERKEKGPVATGTLTISGVKLRLAMWPARVAGGTGKGAGKKFWSVAVEYPQGARAFLAKCSPASVVVTGAAAEVAPAPGEGAAPAADDTGDMPF